MDKNDEKLWRKIKTEYITTDTSYRKLAKKYGVPVSNLQRRATKEKWVNDKSLYEAKVVSESVDAIAIEQSNQIVVATEIGNMMLQKIKESLETLEADDRQGLKQLTSALKDLKEMKIFVNEMDKREQEARINKLRKDAEDEQKDNTITIVMEGADEYVN